MVASPKPLREAMTNSSDILPGTLDLLILKAASLGSLHGFGVMLRIQQISRGALRSQSRARSIRLFTGSRKGAC